MTEFKQRAKQELDQEKLSELNSLNSRFIRWQDRLISLLTFSINLIFTISVATLGVIFSNYNDEIFNDKLFFEYSLTYITISVIYVSILCGVCALIFRLIDFRSTLKVIKTRKQLFKLKNKLENIACKQLNETELNV